MTLQRRDIRYLLSVPTRYRQTLEDLRQAKAGNRAPLYDVLGRYQERLLGRIRWMLGPRARRAAESSDFLHEVIVDIVEDLDRFEPRDERSFLSWATAIARNKIRRYASAKHVAAFETFVTASVDGAVHDREVARPVSVLALRESTSMLLETLGSLPQDQRVAIELRNFDALSFREIGELLERSENAAQLLHARALTELGSRLRADVD